MELNLYDRQTILAIDHSSFIPCALEVFRLEEESVDLVEVHLVEEEEIAKLHGDYFDDPSPTDCISFPMDSDGEPFRFLGELFLSPKAAIDYVTLHGGEVMEELTLYFVHCLLHLIGYRDENEEERLVMENRQEVIMSHLRQVDSYLRRLS